MLRLGKSQGLPRRRAWSFPWGCGLLGLLWLACGVCLAQAPGKEPVHAGLPLSEWAKRVRSADFKTQQEARKVIEALGPEAAPAIPELITAPGGSDLIRKMGPAAVPGLIALLDRPKGGRGEPEIAAGTLGRMGVDAVPGILAGLPSASASQRVALMEVLYRIGDKAKASTKDLLPYLTDPVPDVRLRTAMAVCRIDVDAHPHALPVLRSFVKDVDEDRRTEAAEAIGDALERACKAGTWTAAHEEALGVFKGLLRSEERRVRRAALTTAANIASGDQKFQVLYAGSDVAPQRVQVRELHARLARELFPLVHEGLSHDDAAMVSETVSVLGTYGPRAEPLVPRLVELMRSHPETATAVLMALGYLGVHATEAVDAVRAMTEHPDLEIQRAAYAALQRITTAIKNAPATLARDRHRGYTGFSSKDNVYRLEAAEEEDLSRTRLRFRARGDRSPNTFGVIRASWDGKTWYEIGRWSKKDCEEAAQRDHWHELSAIIPSGNMYHRGKTLFVRFEYTGGSQQLNIDEVIWERR